MAFISGGWAVRVSLRDSETSAHVEQKIGRIHARRIPPIQFTIPTLSLGGHQVSVRTAAHTDFL
jgi:hypothetical protein